MNRTHGLLRRWVLADPKDQRTTVSVSEGDDLFRELVLRFIPDPSLDIQASGGFFEGNSLLNSMSVPSVTPSEINPCTSAGVTSDSRLGNIVDPYLVARFIQIAG